MSLALAAIAAAGCVLRLVQYGANASLWNDEQLLALNIGRRTILELLRPLDHDQSAPVGFLVVVRAVTRLFGMNEHALRAVPLLAGMGTVILGVVIARRLLSPAFAVLAALLFAFGPKLMAWSDSAKPYGVDAFAATVMLLAVHAAITKDRREGWIALAVAGVLALFFSTPMLFVLPCIILALALDSRARWRPLVATAAAWGVVAVALYLLVLRHESTDAYHYIYMRGAFPLAGHRLAVFRENTLEALLGGLLIPFEFSAIPGAALGVAVLLAILAGTAVLLRRDRALAVLLAGPFVVSLGAALAGVYPLRVRLQLFLVPSLILLAATGVEALAARLPARARVALAAGLVLLALATTARTARYVAFHRRASEDPRLVLAEWRRDTAPGDAVYIASRGVPAWLYYTTDWTRPDPERLDWFAHAVSWGGPIFRNAAGRGHAVRHEGYEWVRHDTPTPEIIGTPSGMQITTAGITQRVPDTGWAENEASRMRDAGIRWVFFAHALNGEDRLLLAAAQAAGGDTTRQTVAAGSALYRVTWTVPQH